MVRLFHVLGALVIGAAAAESPGADTAAESPFAEARVCTTSESALGLRTSMDFAKCSEGTTMDLLKVLMGDLSDASEIVVCAESAFVSGTTDENAPSPFVPCLVQMAQSDLPNDVFALMKDMVSEGSKICKCSPDLGEQMPPCGQWKKAKLVGTSAAQFCSAMQGAAEHLPRELFEN
ncbi:unnamed protein product [Chrysoparadoxa australica]